jgi:leader peptidase (prepilin peptidase)/N-methyltransferase
VDVPVTTALALLGGAVAGSAAGAAMHRWPTGRTLAAPARSACDACGRTLGIGDLVPVISWVLLRGRCRTCDATIDPMSPMVELAAAAIVAVLVGVHGHGSRGVLVAAGGVAALLAAIIDLEHRIVPDRLTIPLGVVGLAGLPLVVADRATLAVAATWAVGVPLCLHVASIAALRAGAARPIGGGDVKLLVGLLALSAVALDGPAALLIVALVSGGSLAAVALAAGLVERGSRMPFAPAIALGYLVVAVSPDRAVDIVATFGGQLWNG